MPIKKGSRFDGGYATVGEEDGVNYREMSEIMTQNGFEMNHSSARNYVLRVMRKFADELMKEWGLSTRDFDAEIIAKSPQFQQGIGEILQELHIYDEKGTSNVKSSC